MCRSPEKRQLVFYIKSAVMQGRTAELKIMSPCRKSKNWDILLMLLLGLDVFLRHRFLLWAESSPSFDIIERKTQTGGDDNGLTWIGTAATGLHVPCPCGHAKLLVAPAAVRKPSFACFSGISGAIVLVGCLGPPSQPTQRF